MPLKSKYHGYLLFFLSFFWGQETWAQSPPTLVTLHFDQVSIEVILKELESQSTYTFSYRNDVFPPSKKYSLHATKEDFNSLLLRWFKEQHITFKVINQTIILSSSKSPPIALSGWVRDQTNGEALNSIDLVIKGAHTYTTKTNFYGYYSFSLPPGSYLLSVHGTSTYDAFQVNFNLENNQRYDVALHPLRTHQLKEVKVLESRPGQPFLSQPQRNNAGISLARLQQLPSLGGEPDLFKSIQFLPGVKNGIHGTMDNYVRGGNKGENLILIDDAPVYYPGHLLGVISILNPNSIQDFSLYKDNFSAELGGRTSSAMIVKTKEGNLYHPEAQVSVNPTCLGLSLEGPIQKGKSSIILNARRSYADLILQNTKYNIPYFFYDIQGKINYILNPSNRFYFSSYTAADHIKSSASYLIAALFYRNDTARIASGLMNSLQTFRWNHVFKNQKTFMNITLLQSSYKLKLDVTNTRYNSLSLSSTIQDWGLKADFTHAYSHHDIKYGLQLSRKKFNPNVALIDSLPSAADETLRSHEGALYFQDQWQLHPRIKLHTGLRLSFMENKKIYLRPEPRVSMVFQLDSTQSIKTAYSRMVQYAQLISNAYTTTLPTDIWLPSNETLKPLSSDQVSLGYYKVLASKSLYLNADVYYRKLKHLAEYAQWSSLLVSQDVYKSMSYGHGEAYGLEFCLNKTQGRYHTILSYAYSYSTRTFEGVNQNQRYYSNFDKRHDVSFSNHYKLSNIFSGALVFVYTSGAPFTPQIGQYHYQYPDQNGFATIPIYGAKNSMRYSPCYRIDAEICFHLNPKSKQAAKLKVGAYNVMNRTQPDLIQYAVDASLKSDFYQLGFLGIVPYISFTKKFTNE